jgi:type II secretory ATPase GspE/PulE/Tfp pilus assembly ATPase PilB-like protein
MAGSLQQIDVRVSTVPLCNGESMVLRLFEPTGRPRRPVVRMPLLDLEFPVELKPFELKTLAVDPETREIRETDLLERADE